MIKGKKVYLTAVERADLEQLKCWRNDVDFRKHFREYRELNAAMQERWFEEKVSKDPSTRMFSIRRLADNRLLGCCGLVYIDWIARSADCSIYIGWNKSYIDDKGYALESCRLLFDYGFDVLGLNKIWTEIYIFDKKKKKMYDKLGLKVDGILRDNCFYDGKFWDSYILSLLAPEWKRKK